MTLYFLESENGADPMEPEEALRVQRLLISRQVRNSFSDTEIYDFVRRHELGEWGPYKVAWDEHNELRLSYGSVCSCFEIEDQRLLRNSLASPGPEFPSMQSCDVEQIGLRLLVKTALNRKRTVIRFDHERLETRRYWAARAKGVHVRSPSP